MKILRGLIVAKARSRRTEGGAVPMEGRAAQVKANGSPRGDASSSPRPPSPSRCSLILTPMILKLAERRAPAIWGERLERLIK